MHVRVQKYRSGPTRKGIRVQVQNILMNIDVLTILYKMVNNEMTELLSREGIVERIKNIIKQHLINSQKSGVFIKERLNFYLSVKPIDVNIYGFNYSNRRVISYRISSYSNYQHIDLEVYDYVTPENQCIEQYRNYVSYKPYKIFPWNSEFLHDIQGLDNYITSILS